MTTKEDRAKIIKKWEDSGILDGLKGPNPDTEKKIAALYCCQASQLIIDEMEKDKIKKEKKC